MEEKQLMSTATWMSFLRALERIHDAVDPAKRASVRQSEVEVWDVARQWRSALLVRFNRDVSTATRAADAEPEQQTGG